MKYKNLLSMLFTGIIFVGCGFLTGFIIANEKPPAIIDEISYTTPPLASIEANPVVSTNIEATKEPEYYGVRYLIKLNGNNLCLYELDGENKKELKSTEINASLFPENDIKEIKNGIFSGTKEGALEIYENFIS